MAAGEPGRRRAEDEEDEEDEPEGAVLAGGFVISTSFGAFASSVISAKRSSMDSGFFFLLSPGRAWMNLQDVLLHSPRSRKLKQ